MQVQLNPTPDDNTAAAILAAITCCLQPDAVGDEVAGAPRSAWHAASVLVAQGLPPARGANPPNWSTADRTQRAARWSSGIVGM